MPRRLLRCCSLVVLLSSGGGCEWWSCSLGLMNFFHVDAIELETEVRVLHLTQENAADSGGACGYVPRYLAVALGLGLQHNEGGECADPAELRCIHMHDMTGLA